ncbi:uncharacterized protein [Triticum aestivum]|uniref:uncharacterized protein n=1 Tax=Triticum aestivum TaxID=4565 RepID=UPI001D02B185|nr:uncharacterized protein LOC123099820 [Triticum aestivum]
MIHLLDEETAFTWDENDTDKVTRTDNDSINEDDDISNNESCPPYDILPSKDFDNNEHGGNGGNEDVDVDNVQNSFQVSFAHNLSQEESDGPSGDHDEAQMDNEEAQKQQQILETHWKVMAMTFWSQGGALQESDTLPSAMANGKGMPGGRQSPLPSASRRQQVRQRAWTAHMAG